MKKNATISIIIFLLIFSLSFNQLSVQSMATLDNKPSNKVAIEKSLPSNNEIPLPISVLPADEQGKFNVLSNSGFEEVNSYGVPTDFSYSATAYSYSNLSSQEEVAFDSYSCKMEGVSTTLSSSSGYIRHNLYQKTPYLSEDLSLDFSYYLSNINLLDNSAVYIQLDFTNSISSIWNNLFYYISYGTDMVGYPSNYILLNSTIGEWNHFSRNVTNDYDNFYGLGSDIPYFYRFYVYIVSSSGTLSPVESYFDGFSLVNDSMYEYVDNGGFESGNAFWNYRRASSSEVSTSTDHTEGTKSLSMSASKMFEGYDNGYASIVNYFEYPDAYFTTEPEDAIIEFDWKYNDTNNGGNNQYATFYLIFRNESGYYYIYSLIGRDQDEPFISYDFTTVSGFGTRGEWVHEKLDLYEL
ncbi:MAG: hypothetical protein ACTSYA_07710, partial [Candidatus Kariarchaeaceae archaeon]